MTTTQFIQSLVSAMNIDGQTFNFLFGEEGWNNLVADEATYPVIFYEKPETWKLDNKLSSVIQEDYNIKLLFLYKSFLDDGSIDREVYLDKAKRASRQFLYLVDNSQAVQSWGGAQGYQISNVFDVNSDGVVIKLNVKFYDNASHCVPSTPTPECLDGIAMNSDGSYTVNVPSNGSVALPDITMKVVDQFDNELASEVFPSVVNGVIEVEITPTEIDVTLNSNPFLIGISTDQNITLVDGANVPIVPIITGNEIKVTYPPCPVTPIGATAMPLKTGQTTSYATGDDGDTQRGRDFFKLPIIGGVQQLNHFGNKWRFTGVTGSYFDMTTANYKTANGTVIGTGSTARTTAFPDYLMIDHATRDWNDNVLMYYLTSSFTGQPSLDFTTAKTFADGINVAGFTNWFVPNITELQGSFLRYSSPNVFPPLTSGLIGISTVYIVSSTTLPNSTGSTYYVRLDTPLTDGWSKTSTGSNITRVFVRITNISEL